jgi:hypothetical protein
MEAEVAEGRPPNIIDVPAVDGSTCRYCLAVDPEWVVGAAHVPVPRLTRIVQEPA